LILLISASQSSWDYRHEPPAARLSVFLNALKELAIYRGDSVAKGRMQLIFFLFS
jgi:hypothetical protein